MLRLTSAVVLATFFLGVVHAAPIQLERRINQTISDSTKAWQQACVTAGATEDACSKVAVAAFTTLQEGGDVCGQQNSADAMIDLAKQLNNNPEMIRLAQIFVQQPRNSIDKKQIAYCQVAPKNAELNGLFHCQFAGSDFTTFEGPGNVPLGLMSPVSPAGSCPAKPDGPVPDGVQLNTLVTEPIAAGAAVAGGSTASVGPAAPQATPVAAPPPAITSTGTA